LTFIKKYSIIISVERIIMKQPEIFQNKRLVPLKSTTVLAFPTVFIGYDLRGMYDPDEIIEGAADLISPHGLLESKNEGDGSTWGTEGHLETHAELRRLMQRCVDNYVDTVGLEPLGIWNSWLNKGTPGSRTIPHRHEGSSISGAFYPKIVGNNEDSPPLTLHSPLKPLHGMQVFAEPNMLNTYTTEVSAWEGMLWLFPSWCEHSTPVNKAEERYCISFNTYPRKYEKINIHGD